MSPRGKKEFLFFHKLNKYSKTTTLVRNGMATDREAWEAFENVCGIFLYKKKGKIRVKLCRI